VRDTWEFDDRFVAPRNGWGGAEEYYAVNSAAGFLDAIRKPTLVIHALDDPWIPGVMYRERDWARNACLKPLLPRRGGHVGFHGPGEEAWHDLCLASFLERL
jgi:predicted alpha/beta-fold hydrolase